MSYTDVSILAIGNETIGNEEVDGTVITYELLDSGEHWVFTELKRVKELTIVERDSPCCIVNSFDENSIIIAKNTFTPSKLFDTVESCESELQEQDVYSISVIEGTINGEECLVIVKNGDLTEDLLCCDTSRTDGAGEREAGSIRMIWTLNGETRDNYLKLIDDGSVSGKITYAVLDPNDFTLSKITWPAVGIISSIDLSVSLINFSSEQTIVFISPSFFFALPNEFPSILTTLSYTVSGVNDSFNPYTTITTGNCSLSIPEIVS